MNKKLIRLTESDLHRIVKESVNKVLNEIGDTPYGQYMLGRAYSRELERTGYPAMGKPFSDNAKKLKSYRADGWDGSHFDGGQYDQEMGMKYTKNGQYNDARNTADIIKKKIGDYRDYSIPSAKAEWQRKRGQEFKNNK